MAVTCGEVNTAGMQISFTVLQNESKQFYQLLHEANVN
jgi:hypothetical protein